MPSAATPTSGELPIVGIAVGASVGALALGALVAGVIVWRRRHARRDDSIVAAGGSMSGGTSLSGMPQEFQSVRVEDGYSMRSVSSYASTGHGGTLNNYGDLPDFKASPYDQLTPVAHSEYTELVKPRGGVVAHGYVSMPSRSEAGYSNIPELPP